MRIDFSCPVELWHFKLPTRDNPLVTLQLFNLTDKKVTSMQAAFVCFDVQGNQLSRQVERVMDLPGDARSAFEVSLALEDGNLAQSMDFIIQRVWFADGTLWRRGQEPSVQVADNHLPPGVGLETLRYVAGNDAQGYPDDQGAYWVCVCGRPNQASRDQCVRCERGKMEQFTRHSQAAIQALILKRETAMEDKARQAREDAGRMQQQREHAQMKRSKRQRRTTAAVLTTLLLAGGAYAIYFHGIPAYRYFRANELIGRAEYVQAREMYLSLGDYAQSAQMALESEYLRAQATFAAGTLTGYKAAQDIFETIPDYKDAAPLSQRMRYERAELLRLGGEYAQAIALFDEIPAYTGAQAQQTLSRYQWAMELKKDLDYARAREMFLALGDYRDAARQSEDCLLLPARAHMELGEYEQALTLLTRMADRAVSGPLMQQVNYQWGDALFAARDYELAAEKYLAAGNYLDSSRKAAQCLYEPARELMAAGEFAKARENLLKIATFEDAKQLAEQSAYELGLLAADAGNYAEAIAFFGEAASVPQAGEALRRTAYLQAQALEEAGDIEAAALAYGRAQEYEDAAQRAMALRYQLGIAAANARDYDTAERIFASLGDYEDSVSELQQARYNQAVASMQAGEYDAAIAVFEALGEFSASAEYLRQAHFMKAGDVFAQGQYEQAAQGFEAAGDYPGAREQRDESIYLLAQERLTAEDPTAATLLLKRIEGYKDATQLLHEVAYGLAGTLKDAGDYRRAAEQFALIEGYEDAQAQAEEAYDFYYADAYALARAAMARKDYGAAVEALEELDRENPGDKYADVQDMYENAVYLHANALYLQDKPYDALPFYRRIPDYRDVTRHRLTRVPYRVLGTWRTDNGFEMTFHEDGTCLIDGRKYYFFAKNYLLVVGDREDELDQRYNILRLTDSQFSVRREQPGTVYRMNRVNPDAKTP